MIIWENLESRHEEDAHYKMNMKNISIEKGNYRINRRRIFKSIFSMCLLIDYGVSQNDNWWYSRKSLHSSSFGKEAKNMKYFDKSSVFHSRFALSRWIASFSDNQNKYFRLKRQKPLILLVYMWRFCLVSNAFCLTLKSMYFASKSSSHSFPKTSARSAKIHLI